MLNKLFLEASVKSLEEGSFEVVASSGKIDRIGDTINPNGWYLTNYKKNPVILWSHSSGGFGGMALPPVARADKVWIEDEKELKVKGHFADTPFAQELRKLVEGGFLNAVSVGFLPLVEDEKGIIEIEEKMYRRVNEEELKSNIYENDGIQFAKQELLEVSWVAVPALPTALVTARKMGLDLIIKELEKAKVEKSPACRMEDETEKECVSRKIPELMDEGMENEEAVAAAINICKKPCKKDSTDLIETKEGRVLSEKNRNLIDNCVIQMGKAIDALTELLKATEPAKDITPLEDKGRSFSKTGESKNAELLLLKRTSVALDDVLQSLKGNREENKTELSLLRIADKVVEATLKKLRQKK